MSKKPTLLLVPDGVAGWSQEIFDDRTPLEEADTPNIDRLVSLGRLYRLKNIPDECPADSGIANLALLGYDPREYYLGRGPMEALNLGIDLEPGEVAFRCNLVNVNSGDELHDYSAGNLPTEANKKLFSALDEQFRDEGFRFHSGIRYRGVMVAEGFEDTKCYLPHDEMGRSVEEVLPEGKNSERLKKMMLQSRELLEDHPVNVKRKKSGELPANMAWPWGNGVIKELPQIQDRYGMDGRIIAGVDLINGLCMAIGMDREDVPGATGDFDTDMAGMAKRALECMKDDRLVFLHIEATDEAGHEGDPELKVEMIERFDREIVQPVANTVQENDYRVLMGPDHYTPVQKRTHVDDPVPFFVMDENGKDDLKFTETDASNAPLITEGWNALAQWYEGQNHPFQ